MTEEDFIRKLVDDLLDLHNSIHPLLEIAKQYIRLNKYHFFFQQLYNNIFIKYKHPKSIRFIIFIDIMLKNLTIYLPYKPILEEQLPNIFYLLFEFFYKSNNQSGVRQMKMHWKAWVPILSKKCTDSIYKMIETHLRLNINRGFTQEQIRNLRKYYMEKGVPEKEIPQMGSMQLNQEQPPKRKMQKVQVKKSKQPVLQLKKKPIVIPQTHKYQDMNGRNNLNNGYNTSMYMSSYNLNNPIITQMPYQYQQYNGMNQRYMYQNMGNMNPMNMGSCPQNIYKNQYKQREYYEDDKKNGRKSQKTKSINSNYNKNQKTVTSKNSKNSRISSANSENREQFFKKDNLISTKFKLCTICGLRLIYEKYREHTELHLKQRKDQFEMRKKPQKSQRKIFGDEQEWVRVKEQKRQIMQYICTAFKKQAYCAICGDYFQVEWAHNHHKWIYPGVIYSSINNKKTIVHHQCFLSVQQNKSFISFEQFNQLQ